MADKNRNGIDDKYETSYGRRSPGDKTSPSVAGKERPAGIAGAWQDFLQGPVRGVSNFIGDLGLDLASKPRVKGQSAGDQMFGVPSRRPAPGGRMRAGGGSFGPPPVTDPNAGATQQRSLLDFLSEAEGLVDKLGIGQGGGGGGVDYSGAMADARSQAAANRGHISGIYNQLRQGLESDRAGIASNYGGAIDRSQEIAQEAQATTRAAYDAAQARQDQAVQALGMQSAAAAQQLDRPTTQQLAADAIGDSAARAQNAQTQYNSQQANATSHSQRVQDASRFSESRAQAELDQSLTDRLNELAELQAQAQMQASASGGERGSSILSLAQSLYGDAQTQSQQDYENELAVAKLMQQGQSAPPGYTLEQLMKGQEKSGLNTQDYLSFMKLLSSLNG